MVTTSQIPEEANEPPEPHPQQDNFAAPTVAGTPGSNTIGLHKGVPVACPDVTSSLHTPAPSTVLSSTESDHQALDSEKSSNGPSVSSNPIAFDYAATTTTAADPSKYSPNGTTTVVSEAELGEKSSTYQGVDAHWFDSLKVASYHGVKLEDGLPAQDAQARLARDGPNKLEGDEGVGVWRVLVRQVSNSLTLVSLVIFIHYHHIAFLRSLFFAGFPGVHPMLHAPYFFGTNTAVT